LVEFMQNFFPNNWKEFLIETKVTINYTTPIHVGKYVPYWRNPWYDTIGYNEVINEKTDKTITTLTSTGSASNDIGLKVGTYNVNYNSQNSTSNENTEL